jgi:hypothetical protein
MFWMIVKEFKLTPLGKCPICRVSVSLVMSIATHRQCVAELDDLIRRGEAELLNWTDPLPAAFHMLRPAIFVQLERNEVLINSLGNCADDDWRREDEAVY